MNTVDSHITPERFEELPEHTKGSDLTEQNLAASSEKSVAAPTELEGATTDSTQILLKPPATILAELPTPDDEKKTASEQVESSDPPVQEEQEASPIPKGGDGNGGKPPKPPKLTPGFEEDPEPDPRRVLPVVKRVDTSETAPLPRDEQFPKLPPEASIASASIKRHVEAEEPNAKEVVEPTDTHSEKERPEPKSEPVQTSKAKETTSVHYERNGIYLNKNPDATADKISEEMRLKGEADAVRFREYVDNAPNLNDKYADEIATTKGLFEEDGLEIAPITVLDEEHFGKAREAMGEKDKESTYGLYAWERVILKEPSNQAQEVFGNTYILGTMLHEGGHSSGGESKSVIVSRVLPEKDGKPGNVRYIRRAAGLSGFRKYKSEGGEVKIEGDFFEESFAGLLRVQGLERLGKEPRADGYQLVYHGIRYLGEGATPDKGDEQLTMPLKFITGKEQEDGRLAIYGDVSHVGAYGLALLDEARPGLFEQMELSRNDPSKHREVIRMINSVRPGLYRELRELSYNNDDFIQGVKIIQAAIAENAENTTE